LAEANVKGTVAMPGTQSISVGALVAYSMASGSIGQTDYMPPARMHEGARTHRKIQKKLASEMESEVAVELAVTAAGRDFLVGGRIDGVMGGATPTLVEIKTVTVPPERVGDDNPHHWAQLRCYGHIYCELHGLDVVCLRLVYASIHSGAQCSYERLFTKGDLATFFAALIAPYADWLVILADWHEASVASIKGLSFPFGTFRQGQRELAAKAYRAIRDRGRLYLQAPTGLGKTMGVLYPAIKSIGEGHADKAFYLTAKGVGARLPEEALGLLRRKGLSVKSISLTSKEKSCLMESRSCDPEHCPYAADYYTKLNGAVRELFAGGDAFDADSLRAYALRAMMCPFELSLDISLWCDVIICDYNYAFDPSAYLRRYFGPNAEPGRHVFLIDEAHNMVERAREMYSAEISGRAVTALRKAMGKANPKVSKPLRALERCIRDHRKSMDADEVAFRVSERPPEVLAALAENFSEAVDEFLMSDWSAGDGGYASYRDGLLDLYFGILKFSRVYHDYDASYRSYLEKSAGDLRARLYCADPSRSVGKVLDKAASSIFFSATLTPLPYYSRLLGGGPDADAVAYPSPFDQSNLLVMMDVNTGTSFKARGSSYGRVAAMIRSFVSQREGNYLVYFPSYRYLGEVHSLFSSSLPTNVTAIAQRPSMSEGERAAFLGCFDGPGPGTLVGFAVMGGLFGEGIDLVGDRLSGAVVVGVGLPQVCLERDIIREYFDDDEGAGFEYAYVYPGINKVMQAAGRVIRTEGDRGCVLLIDERYSSERYSGLLPRHWDPVTHFRDPATLGAIVNDFWNA